MMAYDTPIPSSLAQAYASWKAALPRDLQNSSDYDLQGAFLAQMQSDGRQHMGDRFKKPNHVTFSVESQYSMPNRMGGSWADSGNRNALRPQDGNSWNFWASPYNLTQNSLADMANYFARNEPGNHVFFPIDYNLPSGQ